MPSGLSKRHILVVEIECLDTQGQRQAQDRLHRYLETYGYTSPGHGFEFKTVGVLAGKHLSSKPKRYKNNP